MNRSQRNRHRLIWPALILLLLVGVIPVFRSIGSDSSIPIQQEQESSETENDQE